MLSWFGSGRLHCGNLNPDKLKLFGIMFPASLALGGPKTLDRWHGRGCIANGDSFSYLRQETRRNWCEGLERPWRNVSSWVPLNRLTQRTKDSFPTMYKPIYNQYG